MCPEWAPEFPPFNLARLSGVCKAAGYETSILDLNVKAYNLNQNDWQPLKKIPFRFLGYDHTLNADIDYSKKRLKIRK